LAHAEALIFLQSEPSSHDLAGETPERSFQHGSNRRFFFFVAVAAVVLTFLYACFGNIEGGGWAANSAFSWHPVMMTLAFPCFMVLGRWSYVTDSLGDKADQRGVHRTLMIVASVLVLLGYAAIFKAHWASKKFFGYDFVNKQWTTPTRIAHDLIGYAVVLLTLTQASTGLMKYSALQEGIRRFTRHGDLGKAIMGLGGLNIFLALCFWTWSTGWKILLAVLIEGTLALGILYPSYKAPESAPLSESAKA